MLWSFRSCSPLSAWAQLGLPPAIQSPLLVFGSDVRSPFRTGGGAACWGQRRRGAQRSALWCLGFRPGWRGRTGCKKGIYRSGGRATWTAQTFVPSPLCLGAQRGLPGGGRACSRLEAEVRTRQWKRRFRRVSPEFAAGAHREQWTGVQVGWQEAVKARLFGNVTEKPQLCH